MKIKIRKGLFETNSSSVHALTMCSQDDFNLWEKGEMIYDKWNEELVPTKDAILDEDDDDYDDYRYLTYDEFFNSWDKLEYETYSDSYVTSNGEKVVAFGYYGHD